jgi:hypothetical protein
MNVRAGLSSVAAVLVLAASLVVFGGGEGADATQGQAILAGQVNTETSETVVQNTSGLSVRCDQGFYSGLLACGTTGIEGRGVSRGVEGFSDSSDGVFG